jgi:hypothetical protein
VERGMEMLSKALMRVPVAERNTFWAKHVAHDALLNPLRGSPAFDRLEQQYRDNKEKKK